MARKIESKYESNTSYVGALNQSMLLSIAVVQSAVCDYVLAYYFLFNHKDAWEMYLHHYHKFLDWKAEKVRGRYSEAIKLVKSNYNYNDCEAFFNSDWFDFLVNNSIHRDVMWSWLNQIKEEIDKGITFSKTQLYMHKLERIIACQIKNEYK